MPLSRTCRISWKSFTISDDDIALYEKISPVIWGKKYLLLPPNLSPVERHRRRLSWRNERKLYKRKCNATGKDIISLYSPDSLSTVYHQDYWWSDAWNPHDYAMSFDFTKNAFHQMKVLLSNIPRLAILSFGTENAEYNNYVWYLKDCYYTFAWWRLENVHYSYWMTDTKDALDCYHVINGEDLYECIRSEQVTHAKYLSNCKNCHQSEYLSWCIWCTNCIASKWLENAQYTIGNISYTKKEFEEKKSTLSEVEKRRIFDAIPDVMLGDKVINSIESQWYHIRDSKNVKESRFVNKWNDSRHIIIWENIESCIDTNFLNDSDRLYECISWAWNHANLCCSFLNESRDCFYSIECFSSNNLFLCSWLRHKSYCILNKQYTKEEYEVLVPRIIEKMISDGEWWEFFPASLSPFGYNETVASEYYPLLKNEAKNQGFNWSEYEAPFPKVEKIIPWGKLPDDITSIPDDVLNWAIECEISGKPFRITRQELEFYRKHNIPIPKRHPDVRHMDRMKLFQK